MMRLGLVWLALLLTAGASPRHSLPVPPIPPPNPPTDQSAPVPNPDMRGPTEISSQGPRVELQDFRARRFNNDGFGYTPGSQYESTEDKRPIQTPGLSVQVPLR
jgi:hypothetical protein